MIVERRIYPFAPLLPGAAPWSVDRFVHVQAAVKTDDGHVFRVAACGDNVPLARACTVTPEDAVFCGRCRLMMVRHGMIEERAA